MLGKYIAHYKITDKIGEGGMGEVYRAHDTKLNRDVALKILPQVFALDSQRMARFEREAQVLASLNHSHIAQIHGLEETDGTKALVLELVEGETLQEVIARGPIPVDEALKIALQICEGLEAAHEKGIIHRDLKPANIKITPEGQVKILDFGLAKALEGETPASDLSHSPTITHAATEAGVILGTASYMSPEQARGQSVDKRTDIWAFGCVLFEMLVGKKSFGIQTSVENVSDVLASILKGEPDWQALPSETPWNIEQLLNRCLEKNPQDRLHDVADVRILIQQALTGDVPFSLTSSTVAGDQPARWKRWIPWSVTALIALFSAMVFWNLTRSDHAPVMRFGITLPDYQQLDKNSSRTQLALSSDGTTLVYRTIKGGEAQLFLRRFEDLEAKPIRIPEDVSTPIFSSDGRWVLFRSDRKLKRMQIGGAPIELVDLSASGDISSGLEGQILFTQLDEIWRISSDGNAKELLVKLDSAKGVELRTPQILPGGEIILFVIGKNDDLGQGRIAVQNLRTKKLKIVVERGIAARYLPTGHLVFLREGTLLAVPFDLESLEAIGTPVSVIEGVRQHPFRPIGQISISDSGTLAYVPGNFNAKTSLVWVDREGHDEPLEEEPALYGQHLRLSPDGFRLAVSKTESGNKDIWILNLKTSEWSQLTFDKAEDEIPVWTPDGRRIVFRSNREGAYNLYWKDADGTGQEERLTENIYTQSPGCVSPDGKKLIFSQENPETSFDLYEMALDGNRNITTLLATEYWEGRAKLSPDGRWLYYQSNESGRAEVWVRQFPFIDGGGRWRISYDNGRFAMWGPQSRNLFLRTNENMMVAEIKTDPVFSAGTPEVLFSIESYPTHKFCDLSPDGQRFLMLKEVEQDPNQIVIVVNWFEELKRLVPTE